MRFTLSGVPGVRSGLRRKNSQGRLAGERALLWGATKIFNESQRITPVETGALRGSGAVESVSSSEYEITYGGPAAGYAVWVHEINKNYTTKNPRGQWKYLEQALTDNFDEVLDHMARIIRAGLR